MDFFVSLGYLGNVKMLFKCIVYYIILYSCTKNIPYLVHFFSNHKLGLSNLARLIGVNNAKCSSNNIPSSFLYG